jgi:hypothetical protein
LEYLLYKRQDIRITIHIAMPARGNAHTQLVSHAEPAIYNLCRGECNSRSTLRVGELVARILFQDYGTRRDGCYDGVRVEGELCGFVDELGYSAGRPPACA